MNEKNIWRAQCPFHIFFFVMAVIGYIKTGTLWGFVIFGISILVTAIFIYLVRRVKSKKQA